MQSQPGTRGRPGTPSLLRELNDRAALDLLLGGEMLTRSQISEYTGVSKVTVAQMLARLEDRGLVTIAGEQAGGRGPNAALYSVVPSSAYVAGLYVDLDLVSAAVADVTGRWVAEVSGNPNGTDDPAELVRRTVERACAAAGVEVTRLSALVIGSPGVVDPRTGDPQLAVNLPAWHEGALDAIKSAWHTPVVIENDVNLAAMAEQADGAAAGAGDFVLVWLGVGVGLATMLGGRLHRGTTGAAGEIGYLPVHGAPLHTDIRHPASGGFQSLAGGSAVRELAARHGFAAPTPAEAVRTALAAISKTSKAIETNDDGQSGTAGRPGAAAETNDDGRSGTAGHAGAEPETNDDGRSGTAAPPGAEPETNGDGRGGTSGGPGAAAEAFLGELAHRVAVGVASVCVVLDPELVVLGGEVGLAAGTALADRVAVAVAGMVPSRPRVVPTSVPGEPVLRGAMQAAVAQARTALLASVADR